MNRRSRDLDGWILWSLLFSLSGPPATVVVAFDSNIDWLAEHVLWWLLPACGAAIPLLGLRYSHRWGPPTRFALWFAVLMVPVSHKSLRILWSLAGAF